MRAPLLVAACLLLVVGCVSSGPLSDKVSHVGQANRDLASVKAYPKLYVELDSPPGYGPDADALATYKTNLATATGRAASAITIDTSDTSVPAEPSRTYTLADVQNVESQHRSHHTAGDTAVLYILYLAGHDEGDSSSGSVLGVTYRGTSIAIFKGNIDATASGLGAPPVTCVEQSVVTHETGHAMGLVNLGTAMQTPHEDAGHPGHSSSKSSVMYWAVEQSASLASLTRFLTGNPSCDETGIPYTFDSNDLADLRALQ